MDHSNGGYPLSVPVKADLGLAAFVLPANIRLAKERERFCFAMGELNLGRQLAGARRPAMAQKETEPDVLQRQQTRGAKG